MKVQKFCFFIYFLNGMYFSRFNKEQISFSDGEDFPFNRKFRVTPNAVEDFNIIRMYMFRCTVTWLKDYMIDMFYEGKRISCEDFLFQHWVMTDWLIRNILQGKKIMVSDDSSSNHLE